MIISITGAAGAGKTTIGQMLAKKLNWPHYYIGGLRRQKARERGMTLAEYNKLGEEDESTDREVDEYQTELAKKNDNFIMEGRTSWYFIPQSIKLFFDVEENVGAKRIFDDLKKENNRNEDSDIKNEQDALASIKQRKESDIRRYAKYYNIDVYNKENFDFVIDTTNLTEEEVFEQVYQYLQPFLKG